MIQAFCFSHCSSGLRTRQSGRIKSYQYSNKELGIYVPELLISGLRSSMEKWIFNIGKLMSKSFLHFLPIFLAQLMISQSWARQKHCKTFKYVTQNTKKGLARHKHPTLNLWFILAGTRCSLQFTWQNRRCPLKTTR